MIPDSNVIIYWQSTTFSLILRLKIYTEMAFKKIEEYDPELAVHYKEVLRLLGEDPEREGLLKTPERVAKSMQFLTQGYHMDGAEILRSAMFKEDYRQMVVVKDIELYSMCEHHLLPFYGKAHVAYIPNGYITGLSKIARVVECYARRLQVQSVSPSRYATASRTPCILSEWAWSSRPPTCACRSGEYRNRTPSPPHRRSPADSSRTSVPAANSCV